MNDGAGHQPPQVETPVVANAEARRSVGSSLMGRLFLIALVIGISVLFFTIIRSFVMARIIAGICASMAQRL